MKCRKCGAKASVNMRQHKLALCKDHYLEWIPEQTERFIKKYGMFRRGEKVLVAVSGGKDSLSLWDILRRLGYDADGLYIGLGIDGGIGYSSESQRLSQKFADENGLRLHVVDVAGEYGQTIPALAEISHRGQGRPCAVCGLVKRHEMNRIARDLGYDVLATGHNLDDEAAVLFGNTLQWSEGFLRRQSPVLEEAPGLARKVKPLCRFYEREMAAYALLRGIEYIYEECPFAEGATSIYYKELLNRLETDKPGAKLIFYLRFLEARESGLFAPQPKSEAELHPCPNCGQPTSTADLCSFCRMVEKTKALDG
ncbi:MAG: adenine nucleotide alpha hydrolase family protein [Anaerolineae bacterium CFX3]|nr:tRNA-5-methyluridine(54) 2-sulfurtransferase [Anaerolineales bacterium]MCE7905689.1 adenine nucleotide alpha hydrolase family protein [Anaerolineae bacterium CFX3]MCQ3947103.1 tRNA(Ile)-lysidine synthetase [Anaerolineae bacterium]RIK24640.1 MAG: tRNA(Ile)-lysidine synthetase [Anaerolineae bacterium]